MVDKKTGYFNATQLCQEGGRRIVKWLSNKISKELMRYFALQHLMESSYYIHGNQYDVISGTYLRKELFLDITCWNSM